MADDEAGELSERDRRALELFKRAVVGSPRDRPPILLALNAELRPYKLAVVAKIGRKYDWASQAGAGSSPGLFRSVQQSGRLEVDEARIGYSYPRAGA